MDVCPFWPLWANIRTSASPLGHQMYGMKRVKCTASVIDMWACDFFKKTDDAAVDEKGVGS